MKPLTFLALGDSYTIGEAIVPEERWPVQLTALLNAAGRAFQPPQIIAQTGWTTGELQAAINKASISPPYDLVSLLIGVNNQYRGLPGKEYATEFRSLLEQAIGFAVNETGRVVVISIPDWGVTPFAEGRDHTQIAREIDTFNAVARFICEEFEIPFIDITPGSRLAASDPSLVATDGLHYSGKLYRQWAEAVFNVILN